MLVLALSMNHLFAQSAKWEFGPSVLSSHYLGDLVASRLPTPKGAGWGGGLFLRRNVGEAWSIRANGSYMQLLGDDLFFSDTRSYRNFSFSTQLYELSLLGEWDLRGHHRYHKGTLKKTLSPYILGGIAGFFFEPTPLFGNGTETPLVAQDRAGDYVQTGWSIPLGGGVRYDLSRRTTLSAEFMMRVPFTDYIDGISASANPDARDWYMTAGLNLAFRFGRYKDKDGDRVFDKYDACPDMPGEKLLAGCPDTDGDGIIDQNDSCPYQRGGAGMKGCPDRDGDGIADRDDRCPDDIGEKGFAGCPDKDSDGIPDIDDLCPDRRGVLYAKGCPDTDRDSIPDDEDKCPTEAGLAVNQGCPDRDKDSDGVVDRLDRCPDKPGLRVFDGCPDSDGDGITDAKDNCPSQAGIAALKGCPEIKKEELAILAKAMTGVQFDANKSILRKVSFPILDDVAALMKKYPSYKLAIKGHTDSDGNDAKNLALSESRAKACLDYLVTKGVVATRMTSAGFGETQPMVPNTNKANKAKNRRVEFIMSME